MFNVLSAVVATFTRLFTPKQPPAPLPALTGDQADWLRLEAYQMALDLSRPDPYDQD